MPKSKNTEFEYLYRDDSNFKSYGSIVLAGVPTPSLLRRLKKALGGETFFVPEQIGVPRVDFETLGEFPPNNDDHPWHEFEKWERTDKAVTDPRTVEEFVEAVENAKREGWEAFIDGVRMDLDDLLRP